MANFWFYIELGLHHVLDISAYDHILFLAALSLPFTFKNWKKIVILATVFTIAHCLSLGLSVYEVLVIDSGLIEFLIPVTILLTAIFDLVYLKSNTAEKSIALHILATTFFGLIHGFGFSNYFKMLMAGEEEKLTPLLGFAGGIELSQVLIVLSVLSITYLVLSAFKLKRDYFILAASILIIFITIPMLIATFPW
ncbi:HupE/UreJ family protein [Maribacter polysaccharolyticus]|uniref:HupE/UreJ family protein n=1 Tax=Maribacter polysaccharolyticus TaxID=3020831 RepID=UPI00237F1BF5|nr:HupE/UreJ family protein [Maribacter polysaccharolyticus]MDE3742334.1 HupE/UreJ family protein [Maribacter polysaccharolyticus]